MTPIAALTPTSITIATLAFLTAFLVNAFNTGKIFGLAVVPQTWLPYVGVSIPFVTAISSAFTAASSLSSTVLFNALQAGLFALLASAGGAGTHTALSQHVKAPVMAKKAMALLAAKAPGVSAVLLLLGVTLGSMACQGCQSNGQLSPAVNPSVDLGLCILEGYATTPSCRPTGGNWIACIGTIADNCKSDAASVEKVLTAQKKAALADQSHQ